METGRNNSDEVVASDDTSSQIWGICEEIRDGHRSEWNEGGAQNNQVTWCGHDL